MFLHKVGRSPCVYTLLLVRVRGGAARRGCGCVYGEFVESSASGELSYLRAIGGLWYSRLTEKNLIDAFIPFLPLGKKHVKQCIEDDLRAKGHTVTEDVVTKVADELQYFPDQEQLTLYSKSGCKRVSQKVDLVMEEL
uniref:Torsin-1A C-terminal domain-containing protein n=1 Tax=Branchiostoma floridae TaxID=7739 RepID=C3ZWP4_BRAFL|eukprot:XP_002587015.1 hypothetical protein BRAFLDRAFT_103831 [Branchiostoma floridae]